MRESEWWEGIPVRKLKLKQPKPRRSEDMIFMWHLPPFIGQKVVLNPEGDNFTHYDRQQARGDAGVIKKIETNPKLWYGRDRSSILSREVRITWENGHENSYYLKDILPVSQALDADVGNTVKLVFSNGDEFIGYGEELEKKADEYLIKRGYGIYHREENTVGVRKQILKHNFLALHKKIQKGEASTLQTEMYEQYIQIGLLPPTSTEEEVIARLAQEQPSVYGEIDEDMEIVNEQFDEIEDDEEDED